MIIKFWAVAIQREDWGFKLDHRRGPRPTDTIPKLGMALLFLNINVCAHALSY